MLSEIRIKVFTKKNYGSHISLNFLAQKLCRVFQSWLLFDATAHVDGGHAFLPGDDVED